jgi:hypothetical protein
MERAMRNPMKAARRLALAAVPRRLAVLLLVAAVVLFAAGASLAAPATPARSAPPTGGPLLQDPEFPESPDGGSGEEEPEEEEEPGTVPPTMKPPPTVPDSLRKIPAAALPVGGAPVETLVVRPGNVLGRPEATAPQAPTPKGSRTPFGLHPAAIFAVLVVGHVFLVRAVTD